MIICEVTEKTVNCKIILLTCMKIIYPSYVVHLRICVSKTVFKLHSIWHDPKPNGNLQYHFFVSLYIFIYYLSIYIFGGKALSYTECTKYFRVEFSSAIMVDISVSLFRIFQLSLFLIYIQFGAGETGSKSIFFSFFFFIFILAKRLTFLIAYQPWKSEGDFFCTALTVRHSEWLFEQ